MKGFQAITDPDQVDLQRGAVIEASAGTGKTYTIIKLVLRLLIQERLPLEQILLVTFTDKASSELRTRIREGILEALDQADQHALCEATVSHLETASKQVSRAPIHTINAFCQSMLREFAFEQGGVFDFELVDDLDVYRQQINQMKREWPADPEISEAFKKLDKTPKEVEAILLDLLGADINLERELLWPAAAASAEDLYQHLVGWVQTIEIERFNGEIKAFSSLSETLQNNAIRNVGKAWTDLLNLVDQNDDVSQFPHQFLTIYHDCFNHSKVCLFKYHNDWQKKATDGEFAQAKTFNEMVNKLRFFADQFMGLDYAIFTSLLREIKNRAEAFKLNNGLISYADMINRLHQQIMVEQAMPESEQLLTRQMRKKFKLAMIDEFQDTSFNQWEIFKTLFFQSGDHRLMVIGDPKQAIYAFRGADVHTYLFAKNEMLSSGQAKGYRLATNYRSLPEILHGFNRFFGDEAVTVGHWWPKDEVAVEPAPDDHLESFGPKVMSDATNTAAINGFGISGELLGSEEFKAAMAQQVALIIKEQLLSKKLGIKLKGKERTLKASDVCVLINAEKEAEHLEQALDAVGVAHTHHKKKNLFHSSEALHYQVLLTGLAHSQDRRRVNNALVTLFFGLKPEQLPEFADEKLPAVNQHWLALKEAVAYEDWMGLFDLLLNQSGVLMQASQQGLSRRVSNLKQLKYMLCEVALAQNLDIKGLLQWLVEKRAVEKDPELHNKASDDDAVNIMTMHVSKGLEFPVVFLFGGFGSGINNKQKYTKYRDRDSGQMVYDLNKDSNLAWAYEAEERQRLFYVAMTRAVVKLFLPVFKKEQIKKKPKSHYSEQVVSRFEQVKNGQGFNPQVMQLNGQDSLTPRSQDETRNQPPDGPLAVPEDVWVRQRKVFSFSSLSHSKKAAHEASMAFGESSAFEKASITGDSEAPAALPVDWSRVLPGGVKTGHVLHGVFEHVDFQRFKSVDGLAELWSDDEIMAVVDAQMKLFGMENGQILDDSGQVIREHRQEMAAWVWHTLRKPLDALNGGQLADVLPEERCHEMAFFWQKEQAHLTGFIDLLFGIKTEQGTDYFILDWKSNYSASGYAPEVLNSEVMAAHQYHWQYQLYAMAVQKWFGALGLEHARLAGALYLFSRGIDCQSDDQDGVFFDDFSEFDAALTEQELLALAGGGS